MTFSISAANTTLVLPMTNFIGTIDWGDGNTQVYSSSTLNPSKLYINSGTYDVNVNNVTNLTIFGSSSSFPIYRSSLTNFSYLINISTLTNLSLLFYNCSKNFNIFFASNVTSNVTNMSFMFTDATSFDKPIALDCSSCTTLLAFLQGATNFNSSVSLTNTSKVTDMNSMFNDTSSFNQPIALDCSSCTTLLAFLQDATNFNSSVNLSNTSKVQNMSFMFRNASSFNQQITLDCSSCTTLEQFLLDATKFNNSLNLTPIPNLLNATNMIVSTSLSTINYSNLLILWGSQPVLKPNVTLRATGLPYNSSAQSSRTTLVSSPNNWNIIDGGILTTYISMTFSISAANTTLVLPMTNFVGTIEWGDGNTQVYSSSTLNPSKLYINSGTYDVNVNNVTNLTIFGSSSSFPIYRSSLTNFSYLINISTLTNLSNLFNGCAQNFTINFASNVTSNVTNMSSMFVNTSLFNQPIDLDCSSCTTLQGFLFNSTNFDSSVNLINTSKVQSMRSMFGNAFSFNKPIALDCSSCTTLFQFLAFATNFNSSVRLSNISKVTTMERMFYSASSFNQEIDLVCPSCTTLSGFLQGATNFNNSLNLTPIPSLTNATNMIVSTSLSTTNYSNLLILWGSQPVLKPNVTLTATGVKYNTSAQSSRTTLVSSPNNWNITDGGLNNITTTVIDVSSNITSIYGNIPFTYNYSSNNPSTPTYSSSNTSVATINSSGLVTSLSAGTTTLTINQSSTENYTDGSANSILTVQANNNSNPVVITNGNGLEYFLTTNAIYAILIENINIDENLVNQGNATKIISSNSFCKIYK
jgi:LSD1 subclass zinc finger protein